MATAILRSQTPLQTFIPSQLRGLGEVVSALFYQSDMFEPVTVLRPSSTQWFSIKDYLVDRQTKETYWAEDKEVIQIKCAALFFIAPVYTACKILYALVNTILQVAKELFSLRGSKQSNLNHSVQITVRGCFEILKAPLFCLGYQMTALYGLVHPYRARKYIARIESLWNGNIPFLPGIKECRKIDETYQNENRSLFAASLGACSALLGQQAPVYIAPCLQPRGSLKKEVRELTSPLLISMLRPLFG